MFKQDSSFSVLYISDVARTQKFYAAIGADIKESAVDKVVVSFSGFDLHFILDTSEPFADYRYIAGKAGRGQGNIFYNEVDDINSYYEIVKAAGGKITAVIFTNKWGAREFLCEDPDGYKFAFYCMI
jgi:catechol 2,3-dioxygenase-like lactoylglutathione lyase family enzyme